MCVSLCVGLLAGILIPWLGAAMCYTCDVALDGYPCDEAHYDVCVETGAEQKDEELLPVRIFKIHLSCGMRLFRILLTGISLCPQ